MSERFGTHAYHIVTKVYSDMLLRPCRATDIVGSSIAHCLPVIYSLLSLPNAAIATEQDAFAPLAKATTVFENFKLQGVPLTGFLEFDRNAIAMCDFIKQSHVCVLTTVITVSQCVFRPYAEYHSRMIYSQQSSSWSLPRLSSFIEMTFVIAKLPLSFFQTMASPI